MYLRRILSTLLFVCCSFFHVVQAQVSGPENVIIDGRLLEWGPSLKNNDKTAVLEYDIHNDQEYLYIAFKRPKYAWNIALAKRMVFEISDGVKPGLQIVYPGHFSADKVDMWNFLEVKNPDSKTVDTLTIYNDEGILAAGRFWEKPIPDNEPNSKLEDGSPAYYIGADGELAIPRKLLPVTSGTCTIRITIGSGKDFMTSLNVLGLEGHFDLSKGSGNGLEATGKESKLSITYNLK